MSEMKPFTIDDLRNEMEKSERAFQIAWAKSGNANYAKGRPALPAEISRMRAYYEKGKPVSRKKKGNSVIENSPAGSNKVPPGKKQDEGKNTADAIAVMIGPIAITALSVCLTITGLYVFCDWAGAMLGGMFSIFLVVAVLVARNYMKGDTSEQALKSVLRLEVGAAGLHCFTFWRLLPQFPDGQWFFYSRCVACAVLAGFAAYLSYSAVVTVRNYNAEI